MKNVIEIASSEIGIKEMMGKQLDNPRILQYAKESGIRGYQHDAQAWCSVFINWVAYKAGLERTNKKNARSWLNVGIPVKDPEPGDLVIFWRKSIDSAFGHVGFFTGFSDDKTRVFCLGGNQGNQVSITAKPISKVLGYRRLQPEGKINFHDRDLQKGDTGPQVIQLQDALKSLGYDCGTSDGIFGKKTEMALKLFQTTFFLQLEVNGVFDKDTRETMTSLLNKEN